MFRDMACSKTRSKPRAVSASGGWYDANNSGGDRSEDRRMATTNRMVHPMKVPTTEATLEQGILEELEEVGAPSYTNREKKDVIGSTYQRKKGSFERERGNNRPEDGECGGDVQEVQGGLV
jgi:hypothetical protein